MKWLRYTAHAILRAPLRPVLAILSAAVAVFLFTSVVSLQRGLHRMLDTSAKPDVLVVFDRYQGCPPLSKLPSGHQSAIASLDGVAAVSPELFVISSCSRATDLVAVHGVDPGSFRDFHSIGISEEQYRAFVEEKGAALIGTRVAARYGWKPGQTVSLERLGGITFTIRGIFSAPGESIENAIVVDLGYLQQATNQVGKVTLFLVRLKDPEMSGAVASKIDESFSTSVSPTKTAGERAFLDSAISSLSGLVELTAWLGYGALGLVALGVGNSFAMSIRDRTREIAILKTTGFRKPQVFQLLIGEVVVCGLLGGILGAAGAMALTSASNFSLSVEGFTFAPYFSAALLAESLGLAVVMAALAGLWPALGVSRMPVSKALRALT